MTDLIVKLSSIFLDITPEVIGFSDLTEEWGVEAKLYYGIVLFFAVGTMVMSLIVAYRCLTSIDCYADHLTNALLTSSKMFFGSGCVFTVELIGVTGKLPYTMNFLVPALFCLLVALLLKRGVGY